MTVPSPWVFLLGTLAAWRVWKLLSTDDILDGPREFLAPEGTQRREFLDCPYCSGFWVSAIGTVAFYVVWDQPDSWAVAFGCLVTIFAMSAAVVFVEVLLDLTVAKKDVAEDEAG